MFNVSGFLRTALACELKVTLQSKLNFHKLYKYQKKWGVEVIYLPTLYTRQILEHNEVDEDFFHTHLSLSICQCAMRSNALICHAITFTKTVSQC